MALSKPVYNFLGFYFQQLYEHPVRTKSVTSCLIATLGNLTSQYLAGVKVINQDSLIAYGLFGLLFGGSVPHYFYRALDTYISDDVALAPLKHLALERLIFMPLFQVLALYMLARLEGKSQQQAAKQLSQMYWPVVIANWKWISLLQFINFTFVHPMLRVLVANLIGFVWVVYMAKKRRQARDQKSNK
ncbi:peroxisomal membrane protein 2 [Periplaneta americana]|uniref:peroxisomal membrane protein 2 n=1 Tax=Periplaneta americana TaxID=6978 RepID=UPI0037E981BF